MGINKDLVAASSTPIVLAILAGGDSYGYAILQRVRELSGGRLAWTDGMLYPVLHRLERLGHVEARWAVSESGRRRKYYRITSEAFLVAVKRMGGLDALSREFALEHSDRLWKQLVAPAAAGDGRARARTEASVACSLAVAAAVVITVPALFGFDLDQDFSFYARNVGLFVLSLLIGYFAWKRRLDTGTLRWLAVAFVAAGVVANVSPFAPGVFTEALTALHLPIALWLAVGIAIALWLAVGIAIVLWLAVSIAYAGGGWRQAGGCMDFIRFSGELFIERQVGRGAGRGARGEREGEDVG